MKKKNRTSLKWKLLRTVLLYWALPFLVLIAVIGIYMADSEENNQLEMSLDTCQERMKGIVEQPVQQGRQGSCVRWI